MCECHGERVRHFGWIPPLRGGVQIRQRTVTLRGDADACQEGSIAGGKPECPGKQRVEARRTDERSESIVQGTTRAFESDGDLIRLSGSRSFIPQQATREVREPFRGSLWYHNRRAPVE